MTFYSFTPSPDLAYREVTHVYWENGFTDEQIQNIIQIGENTTPRDAVITTAAITDHSIRKSKTSWITYSEQSAFLFDSLAHIARNLNGQFFGFDLFGFAEPIQYTVYEDTNDHYDWHIDKGFISNSPRKLSLVLQLSDPSEYEGGDLEIFIAKEPIKLEKRKGLVWAFPSYVLHRVTPVTSGIRRTAVVWISGPKFI